MEGLVLWCLTAVVGALATVLYAIGTKLIRDVNELKKTVAKEGRDIDVRVTRVEATLWPQVSKDSLARYN
jgi:CRISPR/Cas system-associated protein Cas5 (RAMP superfamily)